MAFVLKDILTDELNDAENWHISLRELKLPVENNSVYIIFDPNDHNSIHTFLCDLKLNGIQAYHHNLNIFNVTSNKDLYMKDDGFKIIKSKHILVYLTDNAIKSYSILYECLFSQLVLDRVKFIVLMINNVWKSMRPSLKAILGKNFFFVSFKLIDKLEKFTSHGNPKVDEFLCIVS